jgi:hypothetical protein
VEDGEEGERESGRVIWGRYNGESRRYEDMSRKDGRE